MPAVNPLTARPVPVTLKLLYPEIKDEKPLLSEMSNRYDAAPVTAPQFKVKEVVVIAVVVPNAGEAGIDNTVIVLELTEEPVALTARTR